MPLALKEVTRQRIRTIVSAMNVDGLFKRPALPTSKTQKRRLPDEPSENTLKRLRGEDEIEPEPEAIRWGVGVVTQAKVEKKLKDQELEEEDLRFHGDGLSEKERTILEIVDGGEEAPAEIDLAALKRMVLKLEKAINKNQSLRVKHPNNPLKFIDSEAELDEEINAMMKCSEAPHLYPQLVELGTTASILSLLSHENTDIAIAAIALLNELTDEDVVTEAEEDGDIGIRTLVESLMEHQVLELLIQNLERINEDSENAEDKVGVFNSLGVIENLIAVNPAIAEIAASKTALMAWLLKRIRIKMFDSNKQYASEILAILLQNSRSNRLKMMELEGINTLLMVISSFKRKDPKDSDEIEMMENVFDSLCLCLAEPEIKNIFLDEEGVELMLILIREKRMARMRALKVLSHAMLGPSGRPCCERILEAMGLKTIFPIFMQKGLKAYRKEYKSYSEAEEDEHIASIILSLLKNASDQSKLLRVTNKFFEANYEKLHRLVDLHSKYNIKVANAEKLFQSKRGEVEGDDYDLANTEEERYLNRLDKGLFTLQLIDFIIGILAVQSVEPAVSERLGTILKIRGEGYSLIIDVLAEYTRNMGDEKDDSGYSEKDAMMEFLGQLKIMDEKISEAATETAATL